MYRGNQLLRRVQEERSLGSNGRGEQCEDGSSCCTHDNDDADVHCCLEFCTAMSIKFMPGWRSLSLILKSESDIIRELDLQVVSTFYMIIIWILVSKLLFKLKPESCRSFLFYIWHVTKIWTPSSYMFNAVQVVISLLNNKGKSAFVYPSEDKAEKLEFIFNRDVSSQM